MFILLNLMLQNLNPRKQDFSRPYDSTVGLSGKEQMILLFVIFAFGLYLGFRVWRSLRNDKKNEK